MLNKAEELELIKLLKQNEDINRLETDNLTDKQVQFIQSTQDEVLFGGAAGGGKSYAQLKDAWAKAIQYPGIKQLLLRRTFPELKRSLILTSMQIFDTKMAKYNESDKKWRLNNGSIIEFGYCDSESDVMQYQSAEYDLIRFDELTHFSEFQYTYLISRIRGANKFPKQIKSSTNPGGIGHSWVKRRFIDNKEPLKEYEDDLGRKSVFIPARVQDNTYLMQADPLYIKRLEQLPEAQKKALLYGEWDIFEGQYFTEFRRDIHVVEPFTIPEEWKRYRSIDYGLDMLAVLWYAIDTASNVYVYKELYEPNLIITQAAERIKAINFNDKIEMTYAPPDLWNRRQDTGKSAFEIFAQNGVPFVKSKNERVSGWYAVKEWLKVVEAKDEQTGEIQLTSKMKIFSNCVNLIRTLPQLQHDEKNPNDVANQPHELSHINDSLRYYCAMRQTPTVAKINIMDDLKIWSRKSAKTEENEMVTNEYMNYGCGGV